MTEKVTKIRAGIWKGNKKNRESKNICIEVPGNFNDEDFTHNACQKIFSEYPGWMISGFVESKQG